MIGVCHMTAYRRTRRSNGVDHTIFDSLTRLFADQQPRRGILQMLGGGPLATLFGRFVSQEDAEARKRHKHKKKTKLVLNAFGCVDVGGTCRGNDANCCSGICQGKKPKHGKKDKSHCVAHDVQECQSDQDFCLEIEAPCGTLGKCLRTTGNASFCGGDGDCLACRKDTDCEANSGPGAACIVCAKCPETGNTACFPAAD
jgi:hypothetical protein